MVTAAVDLRELYEAYIAAANARAFDRIRELTHDPMSTNGAPVTQDEMIAEFRSYTDTIPDLRWEVQDLAIDSDVIAARLRDTGTPQREWLGLSPTGRSVSFTEYAFYRVRDGRIEASWYLMDVDAIRRQLAGEA